MAMRCPICGAKLMAKQICPYCKVTDEEIIGASNRKVKDYRKTGNKDLICYTSVIPKDLSRVKIILYTILLGFVGVNHFYVLRFGRAIYSLVSTVGSVGILIIGMIAKGMAGTWLTIYNVFFDAFFLMQAINVILWLSDIIAVIFKSFKVPVVLASKKKVGQ